MSLNHFTFDLRTEEFAAENPRHGFSHSSHVLSVLAVREYGNTFTTLKLWPLRTKTSVWGPQNCFGESLQTNCQLCGSKRDNPFSYFRLLNLCPQSNAETCIFLVTPQRDTEQLLDFLTFVLVIVS